MVNRATFDYLKPTDDQMQAMGLGRTAVADYADILNDIVPDGPDKTYIFRTLREVAMWVNVAITRHSDGTPR